MPEDMIPDINLQGKKKRINLRWPSNLASMEQFSVIPKEDEIKFLQ